MAALSASGPVLAQPEATLEFENVFGEFFFYTPTFPPNNIPPDGFSSPTGVTFQSADRIIVADRGNLKLQSCDLAGDCFWIGNDGSGFGRNEPGVFDLPHGVETNSQGLIAVADEDNHWVQLCNDTAGCIFRGDSGSEDALPSTALGQWAFPQDVAVDSQDQVYGLDTGNDRIQVLRADTLNFFRVFMSSGSGLGQLNGARGIAIDNQDRVVIADTGNHRIQICDTQANCTAFGGQGGAPGLFRAPVGVEVDGLGRIWVADTGNNRIQVCDETGGCRAFGSAGSGNFEFDTPTDVAVHPSGKVAVVDSNNHRIQIFNTEPSFQINAGMNDAWFNTATPGQGFFITVWPGLGKIFIAHFTFDAQPVQQGASAIVGGPNQRWVTAIGDFDGATGVLSAELTTGGLFDAEQPEPEQFQGYGTYTLRFIDCNTAVLTYDFPGLGLSGEINLQRAVGDNAALCETLQ